MSKSSDVGPPTENAVDIRPALESLAALGVELHPLSLTLPADLTFEQYERLGGMLGAIHAASKWWLADWIAWGEGAFGERVYQAVAATGLSDHTVRLYGACAGRVAPARRRPNVPFSVHLEVAALDAVEQERLLGIAAARGYTVKQLRELLRDEGLVTPREQPQWTTETGNLDIIETAPPDGGVGAGESEAALASPAVLQNPHVIVLAQRRDFLNRVIDNTSLPDARHGETDEIERDALNWALEQLAPVFA